MNVYDFDKTILNDDSSRLFLLYCLRREPRAFLNEPLEKITSVFSYATGMCGLERMKEALFSGITCLPDLDGIVSDFWAVNFKRVRNWYLAQRRDDDLIISASPEFLVCPAADRLGVELLATPMSVTTGKITGRNCKGEEKVRRFLEAYPDCPVENFYSDSLSDTPMARIAEHAFLVNGDILTPWPSF